MSDQLPDPMAHWRQRFEALKAQMDALESAGETLSSNDFQRRLTVLYHRLQAMADEWEEMIDSPSRSRSKNRVRDWLPPPEPNS